MTEPAPKGYVTTFSGLLVYVADPDPESISIIDIAHHHSMDCRFSGATRSFYSVAQHCVLTSVLLEQFFGSIELAKCGLLHEGPEAFMRDLPSGVKYLPELQGYRALESPLGACILKKWGLPTELPGQVKYVDKRLAATEAVALLNHTPDWVGSEGYEPIQGLTVFPMPPAAAELAFLERFEKLFGASA